MGILGMALDIVAGSTAGGIAGGLVPIPGVVGVFVTTVLVVIGAIFMFKARIFQKIIPL